MSKSSHLYKNKTWDLVDAIELEEVAIEDVEDSMLPSELKGKTEDEIKTYISKKSKEREAIQKEIQELNIKRKDYILKQNKENSNGLESAMMKAIKDQAKKKKYTWQ